MKFFRAASNRETVKKFTWIDAQTHLKKDLEGTLINRFEFLLNAASFKNGYFAGYFVNKLSKTKNYQRSIHQFTFLLNGLLKNFWVARELYGFHHEDKIHLKNIKELLGVLEEVRNLGGEDYSQSLIRLLNVIQNGSDRASQDFTWLFGIKENILKDHGVKMVLNLTSHYILSTLSERLFTRISSDQWLQFLLIFKEAYQSLEMKPFKIEGKFPKNQFKDILQWGEVFMERLKNNQERESLHRMIQSFDSQAPTWGVLMSSFHGVSAKNLLKLALEKKDGESHFELFWKYYSTYYKKSMIKFSLEVDSVLNP
jgi:hypothetical protein